MSGPDGDKDQTRKSKSLEVIRHILSVPLTILVLIYFLFEDLFKGILRPLFGVLGRLSSLVALGGWLKRLNPYMALVVFLVPFILLEPVKIFSIFWIGIGHFVSGTMLLVASYILSLLIVERMFHVTRDQLLSIPWFAWGYTEVIRLRAWAYARVESTAIWRLVRPLGFKIAVGIRNGFAWFYGWLMRMAQANR